METEEGGDRKGQVNTNCSGDIAMLLHCLILPCETPLFQFRFSYKAGSGQTMSKGVKNKTNLIYVPFLP